MEFDVMPFNGVMLRSIRNLPRFYRKSSKILYSTNIGIFYVEKTILSPQDPVHVRDPLAYKRSHMSCINYQGLRQLAKIMKQLFPSNRDVIKILDVAAGTGLGLATYGGRRAKTALETGPDGPVSKVIFGTTTALWEAGLRQMDAVDPSQGMLDVAKDKNVYSKLICDFVDDEHQLDMKENTCDVVTISGGMAENHLICKAFEEIIRVVRPGGLVVNVTQIEHFTNVDEYRQNLAPHFQKLEDDGKWKEESRISFPTFIMNREGIILVHRVLS